MKNYKAILFHPEGDHVTDFKDRTDIKDVWEEIADMGSRWIFYPIVFVSTDKTIVDTPEGLEHLKGKRIKTVTTYLKNEWATRSQEICDMINEGLPFQMIYP